MICSKYLWSSAVLIMFSGVLSACVQNAKMDLPEPDIIADSIAYAKVAARSANRVYRSDGFQEQEVDYFNRIGYRGLIADFAPKMNATLLSSEDGSSVIEFSVETFTSDKLLFPSGQWRMDRDGELDPTTAVYVESITSFLVAIRKKHPLANLNLIASYTGGADKPNIRWPKEYQSKIGPVSEMVSVTDYNKPWLGTVSQKISIPIGGKIDSNAKLALLRAKGIEFVLNHSLKEKLESEGLRSVSLDSRFSVEIAARAGRQFRFVRIKIEKKDL